LTVVRTVLRVNTFVVNMIKNETVSTSELLGGGGELTDDVFPA